MLKKVFSFLVFSVITCNLAQAEIKKVAIVDDVVSTGASLKGLEDLVLKAGAIVYKKAFVLAEGDASKRQDIIYLDTIPLL